VYRATVENNVNNGDWNFQPMVLIMNYFYTSDIIVAVLGFLWYRTVSKGKERFQLQIELLTE
jgi:hypothetical protein